MRGNKQVGGAARRGLAHADVLTMDVDIDVAVGGWRRVVGERVLVVVLSIVFSVCGAWPLPLPVTSASASVVGVR